LYNNSSFELLDTISSIEIESYLDFSILLGFTNESKPYSHGTLHSR